ncbi:MAG: lasso peptide [Candidatus Binatus sp.]|uniref:lasso peptide n=1 Tax=Candidatus Binatus sp. TaxID=2811406 RepID=UPI0027271E16|nr:lasso peptide [Candidatus Binatus sp.]MDO8432476.1 lasso peptide [Candidatus Binatus sp.]
MECRDKPAEIAGGAKKRYSKPKLEIYGDVADITQHVGVNGAADSPPTPGKNKTKA